MATDEVKIGCRGRYSGDGTRRPARGKDQMAHQRTISAPQVRRMRRALAPKAAVLRARATNDPLLRHSGNTPEGRRVRDLFREYWTALGEPGDVPTQALILNAAELTALCEFKRTQLLANGASNKATDALTRLEIAARSARRVLGLGPKPNLNQPPRPKGLQERRLERADRILGVASSEPAIDWEQKWAERDRAIGGVDA
jgi:hypothetical protein